MQEELQAPAVKPERQRKNRWGDKVEAPVQVKEEEEKVLERGSVKRRHSPSPTRSRFVLIIVHLLSPYFVTCSVSPSIEN